MALKVVKGKKQKYSAKEVAQMAQEYLRCLLR